MSTTRWSFRARKHSPAALSRTRLQLESLDDRLVPAVIGVTSLADDLTVDGHVTLREAIVAAETDTSVDGSEAGSGADTIRFAPALAGQVVSLSAVGDISFGPSAFLISSPITIAGDATAGNAISRADSADAFRIFHVIGTGRLTLQHLTVSNGLARGGNGGDGGGGGGGGV